MQKYIIRVLFLLIALGLGAFPVWAQAEGSSADLTGLVFDSAKSGIGGAVITTVNLDTMLSRTTITDPNGAYRLPLLQPGDYEIKVKAEGFNSQVKRGITLTVGQTVAVNFELTLGIKTQVEVIAVETPLIETERTHQAATITQRPINNLPINGRNFLDFAKLTPGVVEESPEVTKILIPQLQTSGLSFAGQNGRSNNIQIDGVDQNDITGNGVRPTISQEAVREFQINRLSYNAEFGRASAGIINIVSKSGSNQWHGNAYNYFCNERLDARNTFATSFPQAPPFKRNQPGFTLSGPLRKDKTFFFVASEGLIRRESAYTSILADPSILNPTPGQQDLIETLVRSTNQNLAQLGQNLQTLLTTAPNSQRPQNLATYNFLAAAQGAFPVQQTASTSSLRVDQAFSEKDYLFFRYGLTNDGQHGIAAGGLIGPSAGFDIGISDQALIAGQTHIFTSGASNEFRFQFVRNVFNVNTVDPYGPEYLLAGIGTFGRGFNVPSNRIQYRQQFLDNFSLKRGRNNLKFGGDFNRYTFKVFTPIFGGGSINFSPIATLYQVLPGAGVNPDQLISALRALGRPDLEQIIRQQPLTTVQHVNIGLPASINQGFGNPNVNLTGQILGLYAQDGMQVKPNLYLNFGLRYDYEFQPAGTPRDGNNFGPRIGFAYDPFHNGKTVIRGGGGLYYQSLFTGTSFVTRVLQGQISNILVTADPSITPIDPDSFCGRAGGAPSSCFYNQLVAMGLLNYSPTATIPESAYLNLLGLTRATSTNRLTVRLQNGAVNPYGFQGSLGIDREFGRDWTISVNYMINHGVKLIRIRQANAVPSTTEVDAFGRPALTGRVDSTKLADYVYETAGNSVYHGLTVAMNKRFTKRYQMIVAYTLGKAIDDVTDLNFEQAPQDPTNARSDRGRSAFNVAQRLTITSLFDSPFRGGAGSSFYERLFADFYVSPIITVRSGFPFNVFTGVDINGDTNNNDRPFAIGRNTGIGPGFFATDLRVGRRFRFGADGGRSIEAVFDTFNLFNRVNYRDVNNNTGGVLYLNQAGIADASFAGCSDRPANVFCGFTSAYDPRIIQLALKLNF